MKFDKKTAATYGSKGGLNRWRDKDPTTMRNKQLALRVTQDEYDTIAAKAAERKISRTELVIRAVNAYFELLGT